MNVNRWCWWAYAWLLSVCLLVGCQTGGDEKPTTRPAGTLNEPTRLDDTKLSALEGTIGAEVYLQGDRFMRVRGVGLVTGLSGKGSRYCPPNIRDYLLREIRLHRLGQINTTYDRSPEELVDSLDTSVVQIVADIPAGTPKGTTFDVIVSATTISPDTRSLVSGYLLPCDLKIFSESDPGNVIEGQTHAKCRGPIFINPFAQGAEDAGTSLIEGRIIGGGLNVLDRRLSLRTLVESYSLVGQITDAIERRFPDQDRVADASSPSCIDLEVPDEFRGNEGRFMEIVRHLPLVPIPAVQEARHHTLMGLLSDPLVAEEAALSLEGIGPSIIPMLQSAYTDSERRVRYYATRTGLRLGDRVALDVVIQHAKDPRSAFRSQAVRELGNTKIANRAAAALRDLLNDEDVRIRIQAYESLRKVDRDSMVSAIIGSPPGNFVLDIVPCEGPPLIYARRTAIRRIALIGADHMEMKPPLFYTDPANQVMLTAQTDDPLVTVLRKADGRIVGKFQIKPDPLILTQFLGDHPGFGTKKKPRGLGLDYEVVIDILYSLCEKGVIDAEARWEEESVEDWIGPLRPMGRPESEL